MFDPAAVPVAAAYVGLAAVGAEVASRQPRQPRHPVGWLLLAFGVLGNASFVIGGYADDDLDRIISRTLVYGLLTVLLGSAYALVVLGLGRLLPRSSSLTVAAATLTAAALFQPARRYVQQLVDRRFNRRRHDAGQLIASFGARLRDQVHLATLTGELVAVVDQTMQPPRTSLWHARKDCPPQPTGRRLPNSLARSEQDCARDPLQRGDHCRIRRRFPAVHRFHDSRIHAGRVGGVVWQMHACHLAYCRAE